MTALCANPSERARKGVALALQRLQEPAKAKVVAVAMGVSDATISRLKNERLEEVAVFCAHLGIKWVPADQTCVSRETYEFLTRTHARVMSRAPELIWDTEDNNQ